MEVMRKTNIHADRRVTRACVSLPVFAQTTKTTTIKG